jgi:hypothetical protein
VESEVQKLIIQLKDLRGRIEQVGDPGTKAMSCDGWVEEYNEKLASLLTSLNRKTAQTIESDFKPLEKTNFRIGDPDLLPPAIHVAEKTAGEINRLLLEVSPRFFKTESKKMETDLERAEAERRLAVADFKEQGKRIEDIDRERKAKP